MNDVQKKLLEIAKEFIKVCEILNLRYFAIGGTALGAMRHNGFIPWDDDMDFGMPRIDFEIFIKKGQKYLPNHLFIQHNRTEKSYYYPFAKIRNSNTTVFTSPFIKKNVNQGLWIDIFPIDVLPTSKRKIDFYDKLDYFFCRRLIAPYSNKNFKSLFLNFLIIVFLPSKKITFKVREYFSKKYKNSKNNYVWQNFGNRKSCVIKKDWFSKYLLVSFEDFLIRVPFGVKDYLKSVYKNWQEPPPIKERVSPHFYFVDLENSYLNYTKNKINI